MSILEEHGFDKCEPPICSDDIDITILNKTCVTGKILHVEWTVTDKYDRNLGSNVVLWSCDGENFNTATPNNNAI